jgi:hypothetical protein
MCVCAAVQHHALRVLAIQAHAVLTTQLKI